MPFNYNARKFKNPIYRMPDRYSSILVNGRLNTTYNVIVNQDNVILKDSINSISNAWYFNWRAIRRNRTESLNGICTPFRSVSNEFYHTIFSNLPRLFTLWHPPYCDMKIDLLIPGRLSRIEEFFLSKMLPDNVQPLFIEKDKIYKPEKLIFLPFLNQQYVGYLPSDYLKLFLGRILPDRPRKKVHRIYISRRKARVRKIENELELVETLARFGFIEYVLEDLPLEEQIALFYDAQIVVAPHGAGLSNLVYASEIAVIELFGRDQVKPTFYFLCKSRGHEYQYICGDAARINDNFSVDIPKVVSVLDKTLDIKA